MSEKSNGMIRVGTTAEPAEKACVIVRGADRYIAARSPTRRAQRQTTRIALRLHRGEPVYEDD